jgi:hypothetical protein
MTISSTLATGRVPYRPAGTAPLRLDRWRSTYVVGVILAIVVVIANIGVYIGSHGGSSGLCHNNLPCAPPGRHVSSAGATWASPAFGVAFEYPKGDLEIVPGEDKTDGVRFKVPINSLSESYGDLTASVSITLARASAKTAQEMLDQQVSAVGATITGGLHLDNRTDDRIVAPELGFVPGVGANYSGDLDTPNGPKAPVNVAIISVSSGNTTAALTVLIEGSGLTHKKINGLRGFATLITDTFRWS